MVRGPEEVSEITGSAIEPKRKQCASKRDAPLTPRHFYGLRAVGAISAYYGDRNDGSSPQVSTVHG
jgi:hypothetical protein